MAARLLAAHARRVLTVATVATVALQPLRRRSTARSFAGGFHAEGAEGGNFEGTRFYPQPDLIDSGVIEAGTIHRVAYSVYGNPDGKAVLFVHGGPGGGTAPENARFFDPAVYRVVLVDQRGCGKSTPFAELEENTTWDLVEDFEKVRETLGIDEWLVFGGSWGSTLALTYAVCHPARTTELVLRGIFLVRKKELDFFYEGKGTNFLFPEPWEVYEAQIPAEEAEKDGYVAAYGRRLRGELGDEAMRSAAKAWSVWEGSVSRLRPPSREQIMGKWADDDFSLAFARIENHYFTSGGRVGEPAGFFERDGWLLEPAQTDRIKHIPTVIVQGRYDVVCPATSAYELHKALPDSTLHLTTTGHSSLEPDIIERLVAATDKFRP